LYEKIPLTILSTLPLGAWIAKSFGSYPLYIMDIVATRIPLDQWSDLDILIDKVFTGDAKEPTKRKFWAKLCSDVSSTPSIVQALETVVSKLTKEPTLMNRMDKFLEKHIKQYKAKACNKHVQMMEEAQRWAENTLPVEI